MPNIWNGTMFGDLDWPLDASRGLSAIGEFLVNWEVRQHKQHFIGDIIRADNQCTAIVQSVKTYMWTDADIKAGLGCTFHGVYKVVYDGDSGVVVQLRTFVAHHSYPQNSLNSSQKNMDCCRVQWCNLLHCGNVMLPRAKITPETLIFPRGPLVPKEIWGLKE